MRIQRISELRGETLAQIDCKNVLSNIIFFKRFSKNVLHCTCSYHPSARLLMGWGRMEKFLPRASSQFQKTLECAINSTLLFLFD